MRMQPLPGNGNQPQRRVLCRHYGGCLDHCIASGWATFSCHSCHGYEPEALAVLAEEGSRCRLLLVELLGRKGLRRKALNHWTN